MPQKNAKNTKTKSAAILTIKDAAGMTERGRKAVAEWLRRQAGFLERSGKALSPRFTARYLYGIVLSVLSVVCLSGCATYTTTQEDIRGDTRIITRVSVMTFFDSSSKLADSKAMQTEKTQSSQLGSLQQDASSTNLNTLIQTVISAAVQGAVKAAVPGAAVLPP